MASKKKLKKKIKELENHIEQLTGQKPLSEEEQDAIFYKYYNNYDNLSSSCEIEHQISRQKYIYKKLIEKGVENTNIEKYLDILMDDINHQYAMKQDAENKVGFMLTLWGVILTAILSTDMINIVVNNIFTSELSAWHRVFSAGCFITLLISGVVSLFFMYKIFKTNYSKFDFSNKEAHFKCMVDDKLMSLVSLVDTNTNVWIKNEDANEDKAKYLKKLIAFMSIYIISTIVCYCLTNIT